MFHGRTAESRHAAARWSVRRPRAKRRARATGRDPSVSKDHPKRQKYHRATEPQNLNTKPGARFCLVRTHCELCPFDGVGPRSGPTARDEAIRSKPVAFETWRL